MCDIGPLLGYQRPGLHEDICRAEGGLLQPHRGQEPDPAEYAPREQPERGPEVLEHLPRRGQVLT